MAINNPNPQSVARQPRMLALLAGTPMKGLKSLEVENNNFYQADTFRATFTLSGQQSDRQLDWWAAQTSIKCELLAGFPDNPVAYTKSDLSSLITGQVDHVEIDLYRREVHLTGRDYVAQLIDAQTTEKFQNQTASQIAQTLAARHGLTAQVTATGTKAGSFYQIDHAQLTDRRTEWDLLTYLAQQEGMVVFVRGTTLHFQPPAQETDEPYVIRYTPPGDNPIAKGNFMDLTLERALTLSQGLVVNVRTWNAKQKKGFTVSYPRKNSSTQSAKAPQQYWFTKAGYSTQQALAYAQQKYHELLAHEMKLRVDLPADATLTCQNVLRLEGTGSAFDQIYYPSRIKRRLNFTEGFRMTVEAKNHSTASEAMA